MYVSGLFSDSIDPQNTNKYTFNWKGTHPGKLLIDFLDEYLSVKHDERIKEIIEFDQNIVDLYWEPALKMGVISVLSFSLKSLKNDVREFAIMAWNIHGSGKNEPKFTYEAVGYTDGDETWLDISLNGGEIYFPINKRIDFISGITSLLIKFPWGIFSFTHGHETRDNLTLSFKKKQNNEISIELLLSQLIQPPHEDFYNFILKGIDALLYESKVILHEKIIRYILVLSNLFEKKSIIEQLELIESNLNFLLNIDADVFLQFISKLVIHFSKSMLKTSGHLSKLNSIANDLSVHKYYKEVQLIDGTIIDSLLEQNTDENVLLIDLSERAITIGGEYLIGFGQNLITLMSLLNLESNLMMQVLEIIQEHLKESWEGMMCLVNLAIAMGDGNQAAQYRLLAVNTNDDDITKSIDIFNALSEIAEFESLDETELFKTIEEAFAFGILNLPSGEVFNGLVSSLCNKLLENEKIKLLEMIVDWIRDHIFDIGFSERLSLLRMISNVLVAVPQLGNHLIKIQLILFNQYLNQYYNTDDQILIDQAEKLLKSIYNSIDPNEPKFKEMLTIVTQSLVLSATNYEEWELIQDSLHRFNLLVDDNSYYTKAILQIYINAAKSRNKKLVESLKNNDIGLRLFDESLRLLSKSPSDSHLALKFLPQAKSLALKVKDFDRYLIYITLEINLSRIAELDWIELLVKSALELINRNKVILARRLFDDSLMLVISNEEEFKILSHQLELAQTELDLISVDEVTSKRERMIEIAQQSTGISSDEEIMNSFRDGISELLSQGSTKHLHDFLLKAIDYGAKKQVGVKEFHQILLDSFRTILDNYKVKASSEIYSELSYIHREILSTIIDSSSEPIFDYAVLLIEVNLLLYLKHQKGVFLQRMLLIFQEISLLLEMHKIDISSKMKTLEKLAHDLIKYLSKNEYIMINLNSLLAMLRFYVAIHMEGQLINWIDKSSNGIQLQNKSGEYNSSIITFLIFFAKINSLAHILDNEFLRDYSSTKTKNLLNRLVNKLPKQSPAHHKFREFQNKLNEDSRSALLLFMEENFEYTKLLDITTS